MLDTSAQISALIKGTKLRDEGPSVRVGSFGAGLPNDETVPTSLRDLNVHQAHTYAMTESMAISAGLPLAGSGRASGNRRVVVLESMGYRELKNAETIRRYGYAVRLVLTVSNLRTDVKLALPAIAASAELGHMEARWLLDVRGLVGPKIPIAMAMPEELNVETFVIAKQSLAALVTAVTDPETTLSAVELDTERSCAAAEQEYRRAIGRVLALQAIARGETLRSVLDGAIAEPSAVQIAIAESYDAIARTDESQSVPDAAARRRALDLIGHANLRGRGWRSFW